jgi:4-aminobutyrate aminotransferase and related aminotransferases
MYVSCCRMKEEYILVSSDGPDRNVLKLKPPLVFSHDNVDHFVKILDKVLTEISDKGVSENSDLCCTDINPLKTKHNLLYIRNQSVPRSKHFPPRL